MNSTNPFVPQTSLIEQKNKNRARVKVAVLLIFALNILLISPVLLIQACKRDAASTDTDTGSGMGLATTPLTNDPGTDLTRGGPVLPGPATNNSMSQQMVGTPGMVSHPDSTPVTPGNTSTPGQASEYVIVKGDNLGDIAKRSGVSLTALRAANPGIVDTKLQVGAKIKIPAPTAPVTVASISGTPATTADTGMYVVKSGDNLTTIARNNHTTPAAIRSLNGLRTDRIRVGDKLKMPGKTTAAASESTLTPAGPVPVMSNLTPAPAPVVR